MRKVELSLREKEKYEIIKKLVETNGNKERARIKLRLKSIRQVNRLIAVTKNLVNPSSFMVIKVKSLNML